MAVGGAPVNFLLLCAVAISPASGTGSTGQWNYTDNYDCSTYSGGSGCVASAADQHSSWAQYDVCDTGRSQSPIDIVTTGDARPSTTHLLEDSIEVDIPTVPVLPLNTGHSFQLHETSPEYEAHPDYSCTATDCATGAEKGHTTFRGTKYWALSEPEHLPSLSERLPSLAFPP